MISKFPLISALVGGYNGTEFTFETLESICAQGYRPIEAVVFDDGSNDATAAPRSHWAARAILQRRKAQNEGQ